ncbi:MAG: immunoglobulin domain-containing protein, partial [Bacteroidales bacterium]|nr:immunoglobulin domain-containing protein [Bacteroidales bacterium]
MCQQLKKIHALLMVFILKKIRVILCLSLISLLALKVYPSNITVNGTISDNTNWTGVDSIIVTGDVTVTDGYKLTIDPGIIVKFDGYYKLTINGVINATGTEADTIVFTRGTETTDTAYYSEYDTTGGGWAGIELNTTMTTDSFMFKYCKFEFIKFIGPTSKGIEYLKGIRCDFRNCYFTKNKAAIYAYSYTTDPKKLYVDSCTFINNNEYNNGYWAQTDMNFYISGVFNTSITNSTIHNSGPSIRVYKDTAIIENNNFKVVTKNDGYVAGGHGETGTGFIEITYSSCEFNNNNFTKITGGITALQIDNSYLVLDSNEIIKFENGIWIESNSYGTISNNLIDTSETGINCDYSHFTISNNTISNCTSRGIFFHGFATDTLINNVFYQNYKGVETNQATLDIYNSKFTNNTFQGLEIKKSDVNLINCLVANNNYSGSTDNGVAIYIINSTCNIINSTIANNYTNNTNLGAAVVFNSSGGNVYNTIFNGNRSSGFPSYQVCITENDIQPNFYNCCFETMSASVLDYNCWPNVSFNGAEENCLHEDPLFIKATDSYGDTYDALADTIDWSLSTSSECINAGLTSANTTASDLGDTIRVLNGIIDIGAYENYIPKTSVSGYISTDTRWMADTVEVTDNISISDAASLTIDPGVTVLFKGYYKITSSGLLKAIGTENNRITFTRDDTTGFNTAACDSGGWSGLNIIADDTENDTTRFEYCDFLYCRGTISNNARNKLKYNNCVFGPANQYQNLTSGYIYFENTIAEFTNNEIKNVNNFYRLLSGSASNVLEIKNNFIHDNYSKSIQFDESEIDFINNIVINNYSTDNIGILYTKGSKSKIINNIFTNNEQTKGIFTNSDDVSCYIANNTICNNIFSSRIIYISNNVTIAENNIIVNNTFGDKISTTNTIRNNFVASNLFYNNEACTNCIFDTDPLFISPTYVQGLSPNADTANWRISDLSQAINGGYSDVSNLPSKDIEGNSRANGGMVDMGAYENQGSLVDITKHPVSKLVCEGDSVAFYIITNDEANYQWLKDGDTIAGETNDTLIVSNITSSNEGTYNCYASNGYGTNESNGAVLNVKSKPKILANPVNQFITDGDQVSIEVAVTGTEPITHEWYASDTIISAFTSAGFEYAVFDTTKEGDYKLISTNSCGQDSTDEFSLYVEPSASVQNNDTLFCVGDTVILTTYAGFTATYQWRKNGSNLSGKTTANLSLDSITANDEGNYTCLVSGDYGAVETSPIFISVNEPPVIISQPASAFIEEGDEVDPTVVASGTSPLAYSWLCNDTIIPTANNSTFNISSFAEANEGIYHSKITNTCGTDSTDDFGLYLAPK